MKPVILTITMSEHSDVDMYGLLKERIFFVIVLSIVMSQVFLT